MGINSKALASLELAVRREWQPRSVVAGPSHKGACPRLAPPARRRPTPPCSESDPKHCSAIEAVSLKPAILMVVMILTGRLRPEAAPIRWPRPDPPRLRFLGWGADARGLTSSDTLSKVAAVAAVHDSLPGTLSPSRAAQQHGPLSWGTTDAPNTSMPCPRMAPNRSSLARAHRSAASLLGPTDARPNVSSQVGMGNTHAALSSAKQMLVASTCLLH
jgi:hypothetical protein